MAIDISGVTLPNVPANVLVRYPSAVILEMTGSDGTVYVLLASVSAFGHASGTVLGSTDYSELVGSFGAGRAYYAQADASVWDVGSGEAAAGELMLPVGTVDSTTVSLVWANHNVQEVTSLDTSTGDYTTDGVYFAQTADTSTVSGNNDANIYRIRRSRLAGIGDQVRRLTEVSPDLTPEEIEAMLAELDITLEEAYVTPSTEQQEIYPSAYGFSKVIVEAVEDSGGTGGGGPGEGGDDSGGSTEKPIDYPIAEETIFGAINAGSDIYTGNYTYGSLTTKLPASSLPYKIILKYSSVSYITFLALSVKPYVSNYRLNFSGATQDRWDKNNGSDDWEQISIGATNASGSQAFSRIIWANFDVPKNSSDGTEYFTKAQEPVPETVDGVAVEVYEYEDTYIIDGSTLTDIALATQQITGGNATNAAEIAAALVAYASASVKPE